MKIKFLALGIFLLCAISSAQAQLYSVTDLGTLGGTWSAAYGINDSGTVVGESMNGSGQYHAFSYSGGTMTDLGTFAGGTFSAANSINNSGTIVGFAYMGSTARAFSYTTAGGMVDLGTLGGSQANSDIINNAGTITGVSFTTGDVNDHAFSYTTAGGMVDLGSLGGIYPGGSREGVGLVGGTWSVANGINSAGTIVGNSYNLAGNEHAFIYTTAGGMVDLGTFGGSSSYAYIINDSGTAVGDALTTGNAADHAFSYTTGGGMVNLGTLGGSASVANAINNAGTIVGQSNTTGDAAQHAFIEIGGVMVDLNTLLDSSGAGWTLNAAEFINDNGQIVGFGVNPEGQTDAFLLDVVPEPSATALLIGGLGLLGCVVRRQRA